MSKNSETESILSSLPDGIRGELFQAYNEIVRNYKERRWEPSELNGGKLCEIIYTILRGYVDGNIPNKSNKPRNMVDACQDLENAGATFPRSIRIQIPRMLIALYEIRNNRGVGHSGGDVNPNYMDATAVLYMSKWLISELIRTFHNLDIDTATAEVDKIVERIVPVIWKINGKLRVLEIDLSMIDKTLLILYHNRDALSEAELLDWIEHSNASIYRRDILRNAHKKKLIEYVEKSQMVYISPKGVKYVEEKIIPDL
jgi:hypothetical protein